MSNGQRFTFGPYLLDIGERRLQRGGSEVALTPKTFELLRLLVHHAGQLVSKERVLAELWPDVVVEEGNVNKVAFLLRSALGRSEDGLEWIETIPRAGYRFTRPVSQLPPPGAGGETPVTVAVLPFADLSPNADMGWMCEGISEEILIALGRLADLRVVARASSFQFRGASLDLDSVGRELGATHVLEGSVRIAGDVLRLTARLSRCRDGLQVWSHELERGTSDVFGLQDEIARQAAGALSRESSIPERAPPTKDPAAYHQYLHGLYHLARRPGEALRRALECFERALELDPGFAEAHGALAQAWAMSGAWESAAHSPADAMVRARHHLDAALRLAPELPRARNALAYIQLHYDREPASALATFREALAREPYDADAHHWSAHASMAEGRMDEAWAAGQHALALDPLNPLMHVHVCFHHFMADQPDETLRAAERLARLSPELAWPHYYVGCARARSGETGAALAAFESAAERNDAPAIRAGLAFARARAGDVQAARRTMDELEREAPDRLGYERALVELAAGDRERCLRALDQALVQGSTWLAYLDADPRWHELRADADFRRFAARVSTHGR
jgi:TolB-like protein/tetratricopeptide (TPR) repeat protein